MKGILLISHGGMAEGTLDSVKVFFGDQVEKIDVLSLAHEDSPEYFLEQLNEKVAVLDDGDGVIVFADLLGGTPANVTVRIMEEDKVDLISGMNLGMIMECLGARMSGEINLESITDAGRQNIQHINKLLKK